MGLFFDDLDLEVRLEREGSVWMVDEDLAFGEVDLVREGGEGEG